MNLMRIIRIKNPNSSKKLEVYNRNIVINITTLKESGSIKSALITIIIDYRL